MAQLVKNSPAMRETWVQSLGLGRSPGEGNSYPLQYSGLENAMDSIVDGVTKSGTQPSNFHFTAQLLSEFLEAPYIFLFLNGRILGGITVFYV